MKREKEIIGLILILSLILKLIISFMMDSFHHPVVFEYEETTRNILAGEGFSNMVFGQRFYAYPEPLYPLLSALFYRFTPWGQGGLILLQIILATLLGLVIYVVAKDIFSPAVGIIACLLALFHPGLTIYSCKNLHPLILDAFFFSLLALMFLKLLRKPTITLSLITGLVLGLSILSRSTILLFIPLASGWFFLGCRLRNKDKTKLLGILILTASLVLVPWQIRNQIRFKRFVFISSSKGQHFWRGNNPQASGTLWYGERSYFEAMPEELKNKIYGKNELEQDRIFKRETLAFVISQPAQFFKLWLKKLYYFWWFSPSSGKEYPRFWYSLYRIYYGLMLAAFILGVVASLAGPKNAQTFKALLPLLMIISIASGQSLFYVEGRHRWEVEPLLLITSAFGLYRIFSRKRKKFVP